MRCVLAAVLAGALTALVAAAGGSARPDAYCIEPMPTETAFFSTANISDPCGGTTTTTIDWGVDPEYTGTYYSDETAAAAAEPPPPAPATTTLPTWRNLYDWPNGHGYVGWHTVASAPTGSYGAQSALGGQYGLWLWPVGGSAYTYTNGMYVEWTYTAPGTTRLSTAALTFTYRNKLLAHHCIDIGFRDAAGSIVTHNEHCKPVNPPDSQRGVAVSLVDPAANPVSKVLYVRIRVDCGGASTCSKHIPQLDPLSTGAYVRVQTVDMTLVDDDLPTVVASDRFWDLGENYSDGRTIYPLTVSATDAGAGIVRNWVERLGSGTLASSNAPCDPTHHTDALDARICPDAYAFSTSIDTNPFPEGTNRFTAKSIDPAGNVGASDTWPVYIDRTPPSVAANLRLDGFDGVLGIATVAWDASADPPLPDGVPGSGIQQYSVRYQVNGGGYGAPTLQDDESIDIGNLAAGAQLDVEVVSLDRVANASAPATLHVTLPDTSRPRGPVLTGTVVDGNGAPVANADVAIYLQRDNVDQTNVGSAVTGSDGAYAVNLTAARASEVADEALQNGGWVNFDVLATDGRLVFQGAVPRRIGLQGWTDGLVVAPMTITLASGSPEVTAAPTTLRRLSASSRRHQIGFCIYTDRPIATTISYGIVGELHTALDQHATWEYGERADTTISIGVSTDGIHWKQGSASFHVSNTSESSTSIKLYRGANYGHRVLANFQMLKYAHELRCPFLAATEYRTRPTRWLGSGREGADVTEFDHQCSSTYLKYRAEIPHDAGFTRRSSKAKKYSGGISAFGASLDITSGYSKWVDVSYRFGSKYPVYYLCGDNDFPPYSDRIFAGG